MILLLNRVHPLWKLSLFVTSGTVVWKMFALQLKTALLLEALRLLSEETLMWLRVFWDIAPCCLAGVDRRLIVLMMEAVRTSETSVYSSETTRHCIPEDSHLHTRRRENLKSHEH
jgi:hypothetical protein